MTNSRSLWRDLRRCSLYLKPHAAAIGFVIVLTVGASGLSSVEPLLHGSIFDRIAGKTAGVQKLGLFGLLGVMAAVMLVRQTLEAVTTLLAWRVRLRVNRELLADATARLHALSLSYHQGRGVGDTMTRLDRGITAFMEGLSSVAFQVVPAMVYLACSSVIMWNLCPTLALA